MPRSTSDRSNKYLESRGYIAQTVETWNPYGMVRNDLFGFGDFFAVGKHIIIGQATSKTNVSSRVNKILASDATLICLQAGIRIIVFGWEKNVDNPRLVEIRIVDGCLETFELEKFE